MLSSGRAADINPDLQDTSQRELSPLSYIRSEIVQKLHPDQDTAFPMIPEYFIVIYDDNIRSALEKLHNVDFSSSLIDKSPERI